ncbi:MAG TPA: peptidylprolyl isomerase [Nitrospirales bacterium]|nr:peptidylprolyl isomerase [Nitrospirales bacterium]HIC05001.1 peptidylprolyl isomerase [Nitrospirales bacterium]HIN33265.1 peptidylprolyl isomerase [Nitrospirales bacterium]HIO70170.1 peptidylprolyl isomerase [Nitrospirales bacterium]
MQHRWKSLIGTVLTIALIPLSACTSKTDEVPTIADGTNVTIEYTLTLSDGEEVDSNVGKEPLAFTQGTGQLISGLERQMVGMKVGDTAVIFVEEAEAYGEYDPGKRMTVDKKNMPPDVQVGSQLAGPGGQPVKVTEVTDTSVTVDINHPLAGKDLMFDIRVLTVEP